MSRQILILLILISNLVIGQNYKDTYVITVDKYEINPFFIFTDKPFGTLLPSDDPITIKYPLRTDTVEYYNPDGNSRKDTVTTSSFTVDRIFDTIYRNRIDSFINSEIKIHYNNIKLKVDRISIRILFPDGTFYNNNFKANKIAFDKSVIKKINSSIDNLYIVIDTIWFYDKKGKRQEISDDLCWKIKNSH
ncbi:MAG: hypothetical protein JNM51_06625 [Bacteroidia bacterium]|nr:hypothetical protein [Bacteroidia bacterium]